MNAVPPRICLVPVAVLLLQATSGVAAEPIVLRATTGRFVRGGADGSLRTDGILPGALGTFELVPRGDEQFELGAGDGRFLVRVSENNAPHKSGSVRFQTDERGAFEWIPFGGNRAAVRDCDTSSFIRFDGRPPAPGGEGVGPSDQEIVEVYRAGEIPDALRTALAVAVRELAGAELADKPYHRVRSRTEEKFVDLPAPTLRNLRRTKKVRVLRLTHEYHLRAELDGPLEIAITRMPHLRGYFDDEAALLMFAVEARVPVRGRVRYKIPDALSASVGYRAVVEIDAVGQVRLERPPEGSEVDPAELLDLNVRLRSLELSNDVLRVVRREIEKLANDEIRDRKDRIREKANQSIRKAIQSRAFRHPLLGYLTFR